METEVLDEMIRQPPANQDQKHIQIHDHKRQHGLEDMDSCVVGKRIYLEKTSVQWLLKIVLSPSSK